MFEGWAAEGLSGATLGGWTLVGFSVLVALFFLRPKPQRLEVSSDLLWQRAVPKRSDPLVRDLVLLLLQFAVLGGLLGALADWRPPPRENAASGVDDRVWVVDLSLSMSAQDEEGRSRLERVRERLLSELSQLEDAFSSQRSGGRTKQVGPRIALVGAGPRPVLLAAPSETDRGRLRLAIQQMRSNTAAVDLKAALERADGLPGFSGNPTIELFTDAAEALEVVEELDTASRVLIRAPFALRPNLAIRAFGLRGSEGIPAEEEALVRVANFSPWPARTVLLIENEGQVLGRAELQLEPGEELTRRYRFDPLSDRALLARLDGSRFLVPEAPSPLSDALPADDMAWAFVEPVLPLDVTLVSAGNRYLERALALLPGIQLKRVHPQKWGAATAARAASSDLVFFDRFLPPGELPPRAFLVAPPNGKGPFEVLAERSDPAITDWNRDHAIFLGLVLRDLEVQSSLVFAERAGDQRLLGSPSGPLVLARTDGEGRKLIAWGFEFGRSDLPLRIAFPQILVNSLLWMREGRAVGTPAGRTLQLGEEFQLAEALESTGAEAFLERLPNLASLTTGEEAELVQRLPLADGLQPVSLPGPGLYQIRTEGRTHLLAASVLESAESRLFPLPPQDSTTLGVPAESQDEPQPLPLMWVLLAGVVLTLFIGEFWLWLK